MLDIETLRRTWEYEEPMYALIAKHTTPLLKSNIVKANINAEITWRTKDLLSMVKKIKKKSRDQEYSYHSINDKLGIRIVCSFSDELNTIDALIHELFIVLKCDKKQEEFKFNSLEYTSNHYDVSLKTIGKKLKDIENLLAFKFEIQVRTINQDVWAKIAHKLSYKNEMGISNDLNRSIYRLIALYELADEEFNRVNQKLSEQSDNALYIFIGKLEKYVYQYAGSDFDRETSEYYLEIILSFLKNENATTLLSKVEEFIERNKENIVELYNQESNKLSEHFWLTTQPEVFLIWYCIENHHYLIRDNWGEYFNFDELEFLASIWGKSI